MWSSQLLGYMWLWRRLDARRGLVLTSINSALLRQAVYANVLMMERYLPGLLALVYNDITPAEAVAQVEGKH